MHSAFGAKESRPLKSVKIKICGLNTPEALDAAIVARADYAGFVFYPPSPRHVSLADAAALSARTAGQIFRVGLFVDADDALIAEAMTAAQLEVLQLHGSESPERVAQLKALFGLPVWKAIAVASRALSSPGAGETSANQDAALPTAE